MAQFRSIALLLALILSCYAHLHHTSDRPNTRPRLQPARRSQIEDFSKRIRLHKRAEIKQKPTGKGSILDLRMLATNPGNDLSGFYGYNDTAGEGITIIMIDTGPFGVKDPLLQPLDPSNQLHPELQPPDSSITRENIDFLDDPSVFEEHDAKHGTCMASKAVGQTVGVARRANLITVRVDLYTYDAIATYRMVSSIIKERGLQGKAVVLTTLNKKLPPELDYETMFMYFRSAIQDIIADDVPFVTAAGNHGEKDQRPNHFPALIASELPIIVVGSVDSDGLRAPWSPRGRLLTTFAHGTDIQCADYAKLDGGFSTESGTSAAASLVAGLAAYFMAEPEFMTKGSVAKDIQALIKKQSYKRKYYN